ncbi:MAG: efflux RND transporter periplasmic adaptor subunit [Pseudomonadota bacterium]
MWRSWLLVIVACLLVTAVLGFVKFQQIQSAIAFGESFPEPVEAIEAIVARQSVWQPSTSVTGELVARRTVTLQTEVAGVITDVGFASGAIVNAGQTLLALNADEEQAELAAARADLEIAELDLTRAQKLIDTGATTLDSRDRARAIRDAARASVRRVEAVLARKTIRAPFEALAGLHRWEAGQFLDTGTEIVQLVGLDPELWLDFTLPQQDAQALTTDAVTVFPDTGLSNGAAGTGVPGRIVARDVSIDASSRNVRIRAAVDRAALNLLPGALVRVQVPLGERREVTLVPVTAVRRDNFGARVFILVPAEETAPSSERAALRKVTLGEQIGPDVVITSGLSAGERIAATGAFKLREGALVNPSDYRDPVPTN